MCCQKYNEREELKKYVLAHYSALFTEIEALAFQAAAAEYKAEHTSGPLAEKIREKWGANGNLKVLEALKEGVLALRDRVFERLMNESSEEIKINRCPKCTRIARTSKAKQCPWCFHQWR